MLLSFSSISMLMDNILGPAGTVDTHAEDICSAGKTGDVLHAHNANFPVFRAGMKTASSREIPL